MEDLPKIYVEEVPEEQKRSKVAIALMVLVLLAMPVGVYLTLQVQNPYSQASNQPVETQKLESSITLIPRIPTVNNQSVFPVDVVIKSDTTHANLVSAKITFPPEKLEVISIATTSPDLTNLDSEYVVKEWLDTSFKNDTGFLNLTAGIPTPGLKTRSGDTTQKRIATVFFKSKSTGIADITLDPSSMVLAQDDARNILTNSTSAKITITESGGDFLDRSFEQQAKTFIKEATSEPDVKVVSPSGGSVLSYYKQIPIRWQPKLASPSPSPRTTTRALQPKNITTRVSIMMNGEFLGQIAQLQGDATEYLWNPAQTLPSSYIKPENKFQIEIIQNENNNEKSYLSDGPFSLVLSDTTTAINLTDENLTIDRTDINTDGVTDLKDASFLLSQFLSPVTENNKKADMNNDRVINGIDLFYLNRAIK